MPTKLLLSEWLTLLEKRHPSEIDLGLERVAQVAERLQLQRPAKKVIIVAGTNGKGSCVAILEKILLAANYRVGTYTSPHFIRYNERICIDGVAVSDQTICQAFERIEQARGEISLTYFEFGTLAALLVMSGSTLDVAILEVGLGGRLDAVNLVDTDIAIVTSIALDHQDWLGDNLDIIAREKASIARTGKPLIYGETPVLQGALEVGRELAADLMMAGQDFDIESKVDGKLTVVCQKNSSTPIVYSNLSDTRLPQPSLLCALQAVSLIDNSLSSNLIDLALQDVQLQGRFQTLRYRGVEIVLDVAHNPAAAKRLANQLQAREMKRVRAVVAVMADKDIEGILFPIRGCVTDWFPANIPSQPRAADARQWQGILYNTPVADSVEQAFEQALNNSVQGDVVLVFGSFFTVAPVLKWLAEKGIVV